MKLLKCIRVDCPYYFTSDIRKICNLTNRYITDQCYIDDFKDVKIQQLKESIRKSLDEIKLVINTAEIIKEKNS